MILYCLGHEKNGVQSYAIWCKAKDSFTSWIGYDNLIQVAASQASSPRGQFIACDHATFALLEKSKTSFSQFPPAAAGRAYLTGKI